MIKDYDYVRLRCFGCNKTEDMTYLMFLQAFATNLSITNLEDISVWRKKYWWVSIPTIYCNSCMNTIVWEIVPHDYNKTT